MATTQQGTAAPGRARIDLRTLRTDRWWVRPLVSFVVLLGFVVYATWRAFENAYYFASPYLTPFYSPCLSNGCTPESAEFGTFLPDVWWLPYAALTLPFLLLFRFTCYYYRRAYYRAFWFSPPACAVPDAAHPVHRRDAVPADRPEQPPVLLLRRGCSSPLINTWDAISAFHNPQGFGSRAGQRGPRGQRRAALGVHDLLPLVPARDRRPAQALLQAPAALPGLDVRESGSTPGTCCFAWVTLASLALTDFYVMAVSAGWILRPPLLPDRRPSRRPTEGTAPP